MQTEAELERYLNTLVKKNGGQSRKLQYIGRRGCPDRLLMLKGRVFFVEMKKPEGVLSAQQIVEIKMLLDHGADVRVLYNKDDVDGFIDEVCP